MTGQIYLLADEPANAVKIGWALDVERRIRVLQCGNSHRLEPVVVMPGTVKEELSLHLRFAPHHILGEWFKPAEEIREYFLSERKARWLW